MRTRILILGAVAGSALACGAVAAALSTDRADGTGGRDKDSSAATLYVSASGSDTGKCSKSAPCASLGRAYLGARPGDTVEVRGGTYKAPQELDFQAEKGASGPAVVFRPKGRVLLAGNLLFGSPGCSTPAANWVTFDGGPNKDFAVGDHSHQSVVYACPSDHLTLRNMRIGEGMPSDESPFTLGSPHNAIVQGNIIGPVCCGKDSSPIELRLTVRNPGDNPTNVIVQDNLFQGSARFCTDWDSVSEWVSRYGRCPAQTCTDTNACHNDAIHAYGSTNVVIRRNILLHSDVQAIYLEEILGGVNNSFTIENNYIGPMLEGGVSAITGSISGTGPWLIRNNTIYGDQHFRFGVKEGNPTGTFTMTGNLGGNLASMGGVYPYDCTPSNIKWVYAYNLWQDSNGGYKGKAICDSKDRSKPDTTRYLTSASDPHLKNGVSLPNGFVAAGMSPPTDIAGIRRPVGLPAEAGASQWETPLVVLGRSLGAVRLGEREADVIAFYGRPRSRRTVEIGNTRLQLLTYRWHGGTVSVYSDGGTVVGVSTTSRYYTNATGLAVGSRVAPARAWRGTKWIDCRRAFGRSLAGADVLVTPEGGKTGPTIARITMMKARYGFGRCGKKS